MMGYLGLAGPRCLNGRRVGAKDRAASQDSGEETSVPVPCITEITFVDPVRRNQETRFVHDNGHESDRTVHVDEIQAADSNRQTIGNQKMQVERIDKWKTNDPVRRQQDTEFLPDNITGSDTLPPSFITHQKTHVVRHYKDPDNPDDGDAWIDVEWIDEYVDIDPVRRNQERAFTLDNNDDITKANPDDPDITDNADQICDPPWRLSPWQNIVNFRGSQLPTGENYPFTSQLYLQLSPDAAKLPGGETFILLRALNWRLPDRLDNDWCTVGRRPDTKFTPQHYSYFGLIYLSLLSVG
jgi:hypothetical protein